MEHPAESEEQEPEQASNAEEAAEQPDFVSREEHEAVMQRYRASSGEGKRLHGSNQALEAEKQGLMEQNRQLTASLAAIQSAAPAVPDRDLEAVAEGGVPSDALERVIESRTRQIVYDTITPLMQSAAAQEQAELAIPEYTENKANISRFMQENPAIFQRYQKLRSGDPAGANEYAHMIWQKSQAEASEAGMHAEHEEAAAAKAEAKATARPLKGKSRRASPETQAAEDKQKLEKAAWEYSHETGDMTAYRQARLKEILDKMNFDEGA